MTTLKAVHLYWLVQTEEGDKSVHIRHDQDKGGGGILGLMSAMSVWYIASCEHKPWSKLRI